MNTLASSILLFVGSVVGAIGIAMALPRKGVSPQLLGALIAALGLGGIFLALGLRAPGDLPNINFYVFSLIALGSALRVISHPRPVYSALYFILTILASSGLYVLLSAEFMAFALIIVYAGAILITYLFVIMLATESPTADQVEALAEYDRYSREPIVATLTGFILLAALTTMMGVGTSKMAPATIPADAGLLSRLPRKIEKSLVEAKLIDGKTERLARAAAALGEPTNSGPYLIDLAGGTVTVAYGKDYAQRRIISTSNPLWPKDLKISNIEGVGFSLLADHPGGIEVAGVILLMAMLGAVVLARKKVELDEHAKLVAEQHALVDEQSIAALRATPKVGGVIGGLSVDNSGKASGSNGGQLPKSGVQIGGGR